MSLIKQTLNDAFFYLKQKNVEKYKYKAELIIANAVKLDRLDLYLNLDVRLTASQHQEIKKNLLKASKHTPIEYILGTVDFYGAQIKVTPSVLIPRVETELLLDHFSKEMESQDLSQKILLDLCCGSGCLGISVKKKFPDLNVFISDISASALKIAKENAQLNQVSVIDLKGSLLSPFKGKKADFILCNPPYLSESEYIDANNPFEPKIALVAGDSGLEVFKRLARSLPNHLNSRGKVFFEIGYTQKNALWKIFNQPCWVKKEFYTDWAGLDRFFFLEIE